MAYTWKAQSHLICNQLRFTSFCFSSEENKHFLIIVFTISTVVSDQHGRFVIVTRILYNASLTLKTDIPQTGMMQFIKSFLV